MSSLKFRLSATAALCAALFAAAATSPGVRTDASGRAAQVREDAGRALARFDEMRLDPAAAAGEAREGRGLTLQTSRGPLAVELEPFDVRAKNWRGVAMTADGTAVEIERPPVVTYKGRVPAWGGAAARFTIDGERVEGLIIARDGMHFVEPARNFSPSADKDQLLFYSEHDVRAESFGECGVTLAERVEVGAARVESEGWQTQKGVAPPELFSPRPELELATEADFEYFQFYKVRTPNNTDAQATAEALAEITSIVNQVDGVYESQLGIEIRIVHSRVWQTSNDPYNTNSAGTTLSQFRSDYDSSFAPAPAPRRDLAHLWSGRDFEGGTIGVAYLGSVCADPSLSYGLSQQLTQSAQKVALTAHEIGHNFNAEHPNQADPAPTNCPNDSATNTPTIMNSFITPSATFCQYSRDQITNHTAARGSCLARLAQPGCAYAVTPATRRFDAAGGAQTVQVATGAGCNWGVAEGAQWLTVSSGETGTGPGAAVLNVAANTGSPRAARVDVAGRTLEINQDASPNCSTTQLALDQTVAGALAAGDCHSGQPERPNSFVDLYTFSAQAGQRVRVEMSQANASGLDTFLYLFAPGGSLIAEHDDIVRGSLTDSRIPVNGFMTLPATGTYTVVATSFAGGETGDYTVRVVAATAGPNSVSLSSSSLAAAEGTGAGGIGTNGTGLRVVNVTRTGDISEAASVDYATQGGSADPRRDYLLALGTLRFAPGETTKSFNVFVVDDVYDEPAETVSVVLSNPSGTTLGSFPSATLTITDDDAGVGANPARPASFNSRFFVRQHYLDFFNREPDAAGLDFWSGQIDSCGANAACREVRTVNVSAAFFLSIEFQETGYLVYLAHQSAFNTRETLPIRLFLADAHQVSRGVVIGDPGAEARLEQNKAAYFNEFVSRQAFLNAYPATMTAAQLVNTLANNAGSSVSQAERDDLIARHAAGQLTRAQVLRAIVEDDDFQRLHLNRAFVLMQYFGYLRRSPPDPPEQTLDFAGFNFWLGKLEEFDGNFVAAEMVKAFITSGEYYARFGP
ncbi:MAG TPA: M12 family metallo-peptidase [Pyrinomonadaceae bacterium]|nr:M12 family metallo-peptidase [Pyrinomonadaceae bacterium]